MSKERFIIGRNGQPQAVLMDIDDYVDTVVPAPDWLTNSWRIYEKNGNDKLTMHQIDAIIAEDRRMVSKKSPKAISK